MIIEVFERLGVCRWCGCTDRDPCDDGCAWVNARHTLCTNCQALDRHAHTINGRRRVALAYQAHWLGQSVKASTR